MSELAVQTKQRRKAITYIQTLCEENGVNPLTIDYENVFGHAIDGSVQDLNKAFIHWLRNKTRKEKSKILDGQEEQIANIAEFFCPANESALRSEEQKHISNLDSYQSNISATITSLKYVRDRISTIAKPLNWPEVIKGIIEPGFWSIHKLATNAELRDKKTDIFCSFVSDEIVLSNPQSDGRDFALPLGRICINLYKSGLVQGKAYTDQPFTNIYQNGFFHPYMRNDGQICFGNGAVAAENYRLTQRFEDYFQLLQSLLTSYSSDNGPYCPLDTMFLHGHDRYYQQPWLHALTKEQKHLYGIDESKILPEKKIKKFKIENGIQKFKCYYTGCGYEFDRNETTLRCSNCSRPIPAFPKEGE